MKKLSAIPAPAVAGVVREKNVAAAIAQIKNCRHQGADMIDLHLSCLEEAIRTMQVLKREIRIPISFHANGKAGIPSRIINPMLGGQIAFCVERFDEGSTPEQLDLRTVRAIVDNMRRIYG